MLTRLLRPQRQTGFSVPDLLVCIAVFVLFTTFALAQAVSKREEANRYKCASQLRQIGMAIILYSNENRGAYPRTNWDHGRPETNPVWGTPYEQSKDLDASDDKNPCDPFIKDQPNAKFTPQANDVTAALYLLMRTQDITSEVLVCPSTKITRWDFGGGANTALSWTNWKGNAGLRDHLSYSYQNPYPSADSVAKGFRLTSAIDVGFAVASDMNSGDPSLCKLTANSSAEEMRAGNSLNHRGEGQNVLFGDGHVVFLISPFVGVGHENIFTFGETGAAHPEKGGDGIVGSPVSPTDSILLPTAKDIGAHDVFKPEAEMKHLSDADAKAMREKIVGSYARGRDHLTITDSELIVKHGAVSITYQYTVEGKMDESMVLQLKADDSPGEEVMIDLAGGAVKIQTAAKGAAQAFNGEWKSEK